MYLATVNAGPSFNAVDLGFTQPLYLFVYNSLENNFVAQFGTEFYTSDDASSWTLASNNSVGNVS
jgi:hypothetical protein